MGRGKEAIIDFEKALKIDPGCEEALRNRAAYYNSKIEKSDEAP